MEPFFVWATKSSIYVYRVQCNFYIKKKSYKLRRKHQHNRRKYTLQTRAPPGGRRRVTVFRIASIHDRLFFLGYAETSCGLRDRRTAGPSARLSPGRWGVDCSPSCIWIQDGCPFHLTCDNDAAQSGAALSARGAAWSSLWLWKSETRWTHASALVTTTRQKRREDVFKNL